MGYRLSFSVEDPVRQSRHKGMIPYVLFAGALLTSLKVLPIQGYLAHKKLPPHLGLP